MIAAKGVPRGFSADSSSANHLESLGANTSLEMTWVATGKGKPSKPRNTSQARPSNAQRNQEFSTQQKTFS